MHKVNLLCKLTLSFLRSVKGYTRLDKIRSEVMRKELKISGIQDVRSKYKKNWINLLLYGPCIILQCTGLFISPSGISELDCATTKTDTAERSISIGRESLQVFFCTRGLGVLAGSTAKG
jgi:hypothetical protein